MYKRYALDNEFLCSKHVENLNSMQPIMSYDPADFFLFHERKQPFSHFDANFIESFKSHRLVGFLRESTLYCHEPV